MKNFQNWMEQNFVPVAAKFASQRHLVAIRDGFISIMPVTMAGSIAVLLNVFFRDIPGNLGWTAIPEIFAPVISVNGNVWWGTIAILSLAFVFSFGYNLAKGYGVDALGGGLVAFAALITTIPQAYEGAGWGYFHWSYTQATGLFTALIVGLVATMIYSKLMIKKVTIKLPDEVPPAVSRAFEAIIPGTVAIYVVALIAYLVATFAGGASINSLVLQYIQMPFLALSQGLPAIIIICLFVQIFWFFGLHGPNVFAPVLDGIFVTATNANLAAHEVGQAMPYLWTRVSFDIYAWMGGSGLTIGLLIAIFLLSKKEDEKAIAKLSLPMGIFNINEPVAFGLPLVLNSIYMIPYLLVSPICAVIGYLATSVGFAGRAFVGVPWITPPVLSAFLATGGNIGATITAAVCLVVSVLIWGVFVKIASSAKD